MEIARRRGPAPDLGFYFDVHGHREGLLPPALRLVSGPRVPRDVRLSELRATGASGFVLCVLGDPGSFRRRARDPYGYALEELGKARRAIEEAGAVLATHAQALELARREGRSAFVLGIEGGDFLGDELGRLDAVYGEGVRLLGLVHYSRNRLGSIALKWGGKVAPEGERTGLTELGRRAIARAGELGMLVDLAHADERTIRGALEASAASLICSHTGPAALQGFARYISDEAMRDIARAGGLVGLWPFFSRGSGMPDLAAFSRYAAHCAEVAGPDHLAIGTDVNGVPGNMAGYENLYDAPAIVGALEAAGFSRAEREGIVGGNFLRLFAAVAG